MGKKYSHLTLDERHEIYRLRAGDRSRQSIAEAIGRDVSCISRELRRNCSEKQGSYLPDTAEQVQIYLKRMNSTPRKSLGYKTPYESFLQKTIKQTKMLTLITTTVALQN